MSLCFHADNVAANVRKKHYFYPIIFKFQILGYMEYIRRLRSAHVISEKKYRKIGGYLRR